MSAASDFAELQRLRPAEAIAYMQGRELVGETYHWYDLWQEQHGRAFTVSRLARADLLEAMQQSLAKSVAGDLSRKDWIDSTHQLLKDAGWWGTKQVTDPRTGELLTTRFDHARLQLIFDTNVRQAQAAGQWQRLLRNQRTHPYARYITMDDDRVRPLHRAWHGVTLPLDHPWWKTHRPPNGWRCRCRVIGVTQAEYDQGQAGERPGAATDGHARVLFTDLIKQAPQDGFVDWRNPATGQLQRVPKGVAPGFDYN
ncbi:MAG TPA: phage minor head protein, partial [Alicycliphilus sp.]|nr:phage minor head protein [Alicycliphilus sp.]